MVAEVTVDYVAALLIGRCGGRNWRSKLLVALALALNLGLLVYFKYTGFLLQTLNAAFHTEIIIPNIVMPIGISFFTFQAMSYVIDVYRGQVFAQKNPANVLLYVSLFPQLVAGPIVRYSTIAQEINNRKTTVSDAAQGLERFILGMAKKLIVANNMGALADAVFKLTVLTTPVAWLGAIGYTLQIYFDFSAYSDMAIGLGRMFGFHFEENFRFPYISQSITEFWRRWHISLSTWFRDYLYIPLGGNRGSWLHNVFTLFVVWLTTGLWHGAAWNFVLWGLYYFVLLALEKFFLRGFLEKLPRLFRHAYTLLGVIFGWVLFRSDSLRGCARFLKAMLIPHVDLHGMDEFWVYVGRFWPFLILGVVFSMPVYDMVRRNIGAFLCVKVGDSIAAGMKYAVLLGLFYVCVLFLVNSTYNPFIYFRF